MSRWQNRLNAENELRKLRDAQQAVQSAHDENSGHIQNRRCAPCAGIKCAPLLTMLGIIIGVGAVIATVSLGNGAKSQVEAQIASLGQNVILIFSGSFTRGGVRSGWGGAGTLTVEDADAIEREIPGRHRRQPGSPQRRPSRRRQPELEHAILGEARGLFRDSPVAVVDGAMFTDRTCAAPKKSRSSAKPSPTNFSGEESHRPDSSASRTCRLSSSAC